MSGPAEPANPTADANVSSAEQILQGGEEIILAMKPSPWFVPMASWPVLLATAAVAVAAYAAREGFGAALPHRVIYLLCVVGALARIVVGAFQWMARLYLLTNLRVLTIRGVTRADIRIYPLAKIQRTHHTAGPVERGLGVGTLAFEVPGEDLIEGAWVCIPRPHEAEEIVNQAIRRSRNDS